MKQKLNTAIAIMFMIILSYCNQKQNPGVQEKIIDEVTTAVDVKFSMVKRIPLREMGYSSLAVTGSEIYASCYSSDDNVALVEIYDIELNYKEKKAFPIGQGPGDVGGGARFYRYGNRIYVPDNTQQRINLFDRDFKFIKFVKLTENHYPLVFIKNGEYFICIQEKGGGRPGDVTYVVSLFSFPRLQKKILYQLGPFPFRDHSGRYILFSMDGVDFFYKEDKIYLINMNSYQVNMMELSGKILKRIRVDVEKKMVPKEMKEPWLKAHLGWSYRRLKNRIGAADSIQPASYMVPLGKGLAVIRRNGYDYNCTGMVEADYFDYRLNLIGKIQIPCFNRIFRLSMGYSSYSYTYHEGYLYLISIDREENFYLEKWRVIEPR